MASRRCAVAALTLAVALSADGQSAPTVPAVASSASAQSTTTLPAVRPLGPALAVAPLTFGRIAGVRELSDGRVVVNDDVARIIVSFDATLRNPGIVMDSVAGQPNSYGPFPSVMIPYLGDTTIHVDLRASALVLIGPDGRVARTTAIPIAGAAHLVFASGVSVRPPGHLVYWPGPQPVAGQEHPAPDSVWILATDLRTRATDTVGAIRVPWRPRPPIPPGVTILQQVDAWTVMRDGTVAFVRGRDYRIDWVSPSGSVVASPRIANDWRRLSDDDKRLMADSLTRLRDSAVAQVRPGMRPLFDGFGMMTGTTSAGTPPRPVIVPPPISMDVMPDYLPVFTIRNTMADAADRVWILRAGDPLQAAIYDVVDRSGRLVDRIRIPVGSEIVGFGAGDVVYLTARDAGRSHLSKVRFK